jgi:hypothetical protein
MVRAVFDFLDPNIKRIACGVLLMSTVAGMVVLTRPHSAFNNAPINKEIQRWLAHPQIEDGIVRISWSPEQIGAAKRWLALDYIFALVYTAFFSLLCTLLSEQSSDLVAAGGKVFSWVVLSGAFFDMGENTVLWLLLNGGQGTTALELVRCLGRAKWVMPLLTFIYSLIWASAYLFARLGWKH